MKKIKILTFLGILLCTFFISNLNYKASASSEKITFQRIDFFYNDNFVVTNYEFIGTQVVLEFEVESDLFIDNEYLQDTYSIIYNTYFYFLNFENINTYETTQLSFAEISGNKLTAQVSVHYQYFFYYHDVILNIPEQEFFNNFNLYLDDLSNYFKLYVKINPTKEYDDGDNFADKYGVNMVYKTLNFYDIINPTFNFTGNWWENGTDTYIFQYKAFEESLEELIRLWGALSPIFMKLYTPVSTFDYLRNYNSIPVNNIGWTTYDGSVYLIIKQDYFDSSRPILPQLGDLAEIISVDAWVVAETTDEYQLGYNTGYQHGYNTGFQSGHNQGYNEGFSDGEIVGFNNGFDNGYSQGHEDGYYYGFDIGYDIGYDEGLQVSESEAYEKGYMDGASESFIANIDKWLVPAIIIVMLAGGYFAIARKKQDGDI